MRFKLTNQMTLFTFSPLLLLCMVNKCGASPAGDTAKVALPDSVVTFAKAAFDKNKCGACHSVGEFAAPKDPARKLRDLSGVGLKRTGVWISAWLQKKEKIDGHPHIKPFTGTDAERIALSRWLSSQKAQPKPEKATGTK